MKQYQDLLTHILENGASKEDRTGTGTLSVFGHQMRFDLTEGFPLVTTKRCHLRSIIHELLWFLNGDTNIQYLNDNKVRIWDEWAAPEDVLDRDATVDNLLNTGKVFNTHEAMTSTHLINKLAHYQTVEDFTELCKEAGLLPKDHIVYKTRKGDLGPVYGHQWRSWEAVDGRTIDQISEAIELLKNDPDSRRIIVSAWNVGELDKMALMPCHALFQFYTVEMSVEERFEHWVFNTPSDVLEEWKDGPVTTYAAWAESEHGLAYPTRKLSCQLFQRSCDTFLGLPFNIASYALLTHMIAQQCNMIPDEFVWTGGDVHLYKNHMQQANVLLSREPKALPYLHINRKPSSIFDYKIEDFEIRGYEPHDHIPAPIAV